MLSTPIDTKFLNVQHLQNFYTDRQGEVPTREFDQNEIMFQNVGGTLIQISPVFNIFYTENEN